MRNFCRQRYPTLRSLLEAVSADLDNLLPHDTVASYDSDGLPSVPPGAPGGGFSALWSFSALSTMWNLIQTSIRLVLSLKIGRPIPRLASPSEESPFSEYVRSLANESVEYQVTTRDIIDVIQIKRAIQAKELASPASVATESKSAPSTSENSGNRDADDRGTDPTGSRRPAGGDGSGKSRSGNDESANDGSGNDGGGGNRSGENQDDEYDRPTDGMDQSGHQQLHVDTFDTSKHQLDHECQITDDDLADQQCAGGTSQALHAPLNKADTDKKSRDAKAKLYCRLEDSGHLPQRSDYLVASDCKSAHDPETPLHCAIASAQCEDGQTQKPNLFFDRDSSLHGAPDNQATPICKQDGSNSSLGQSKISSSGNSCRPERLLAPMSSDGPSPNSSHTTFSVQDPNLEPYNQIFKKSFTSKEFRPSDNLTLGFPTGETIVKPESTSRLDAQAPQTGLVNKLGAQPTAVTENANDRMQSGSNKVEQAKDTGQKRPHQAAHLGEGIREMVNSWRATLPTLSHLGPSSIVEFESPRVGCHATMTDHAGTIPGQFFTKPSGTPEDQFLDESNSMLAVNFGLNGTGDDIRILYLVKEEMDTLIDSRASW